MLKNRMLSFSVIVSLGFILVVSLGITAVLDLFSNHLKSMFPDTAVVIFYILNQVITLTVVTIIFAVVFKVLPDARIRWKDVFAGAFVTAILFMLGKFAISWRQSGQRLRRMLFVLSSALGPRRGDDCFGGPPSPKCGGGSGGACQRERSPIAQERICPSGPGVGDRHTSQFSPAHSRGGD